jgi:hypothetical protein
MKILFLIGQFQPVCEAEAFILHNIISSEAFSRDEITVLSHQRISNDSSHPTKVSYSNVIKTVEFVDFYSLDYAIFKRYLKSKCLFARPFLQLAYLAARTKKDFFSKHKGPAQLLSARLFVKKASKILKEDKTDLIISISGDFGCQLAAEKLTKKTGIPHSCYYVDPMHTFPGYAHFSKEKLQTLEKGWLDSSLVSFLPPILKENYDAVSAKILFFDYPSSFRPTKTENSKDSKQILYCGSFLQSIREPASFFALAKILPNYSFVCLGEMPKGLSARYQNFPQNVRFLPKQNVFEMEKTIEQSEILLNMENEVGNQVPSKVYLYLFSQKPLINLLSANASIPDQFNPLKQYPLILNLPKKVDYSENMTQIQAFFEELPSKTITENQLSAYANFRNETICQQIHLALDKAINRE